MSNRPISVSVTSASASKSPDIASASASCSSMAIARSSSTSGAWASSARASVRVAIVLLSAPCARSRVAAISSNRAAATGCPAATRSSAASSHQVPGRPGCACSIAAAAAADLLASWAAAGPRRSRPWSGCAGT